jgi:hypothetical protein
MPDDPAARTPMGRRQAQPRRAATAQLREVRAVTLTLAEGTAFKGTRDDLAGLGSKIEPSGNGMSFRAQCPAHADRTPSLSVTNLPAEGKILVNCQAGCQTQDVMSAMGRTMAHLFDDAWQSTNGNVAAVEESYHYTDEHGTLVYRIVRAYTPDGGKTFRLDPKGAKPIVPYRLPELLEAVAEGKVVFVVEGEKDVDTLRRHGLVATTNPFGAGKWRDGWGKQYFVGAKVVIIPDNDEPGRAHADQVAASLLPHASTVKIVKLPGVGDKGDVSDWLVDHDTNGLFELARDAPELDADAMAACDAPNGALSANPLCPQSPQGALSANPLCSQSAPEWPEMAEAAFFGLPGEIVETLRPQTEADPVAILLTYLVTFGVAVGRRPHALADAAEHPGRLFVVVVGGTSKARKGTSWAQVRRIFSGAEHGFTTERILGGFGSGEALVDAVAEGDDHRLLVIEPEWARVLSVGRRDGSTFSPLIRQAWDGDRLAVRSRSAGAVSADDAHIGVLGHVTVEELRAKLVETEVANGYANRHLFVLARRSKLLPTGGNLADSDIQDLSLKTQNALTVASKFGRMTRTPEAEELWRQMYLDMAEDDPGGLLGAIIARDAAQVLRFSVLYALTDGSQSIDTPHLEAAGAVWDYCRAGAAFIFGGSLGNPLADKLLRALVDAGPDGLSGREEDRAVGGHAPKTKLDAARGQLSRLGLTFTRTVETGGRPVTITVASQFRSADKAD